MALRALHSASWRTTVVWSSAISAPVFVDVTAVVWRGAVLALSCFIETALAAK